MSENTEPNTLTCADLTRRALTAVSGAPIEGLTSYGVSVAIASARFADTLGVVIDAENVGSFQGDMIGLAKAWQNTLDIIAPKPKTPMQLWLEALRSGGYTQTTGRLRRKEAGSYPVSATQ